MKQIHLAFLTLAVLVFPSSSPGAHLVGPVPESLREKLDLSHFYRKYTDARGFAVLASDKVSDYALHEARHIINKMLAGRRDIRQGLIDLNYRCGIMAADEFTTDIPEHADLTPASFWDRRARGLGPTRRRPVVTCGEENLLQFPGDHYEGENILIHEFAHAIHEVLREIEPGFDKQLLQIYRQALKEGLWKDKYAASNHYEYFAECVQSYFDDNQEPDKSHNHVNTRQELFDYDPRVAKLIDKTFRQNPWRYVPPTKRKKPDHLKGFNLAEAGTFQWPAHLEETRKRRLKKAGSSIEHVIQNIEGWQVETDIQLLEGFHEESGRKALSVLTHKLREISVTLPPDKVAALRKITIYIDREHPRLKSMQYHPSAKWLRDNNHDTNMARCVHIPRARALLGALPVNQQPAVLLHELAHAYHDQVLGFNEKRIKGAWQKFKKSGRYEQVLHISGRQREHYALTDQKEFFAEMTEAFFGVNDFYPFVRGELKEAEPELYKLLETIWIKEQ